MGYVVSAIPRHLAGDFLLYADTLIVCKCANVLMADSDGTAEPHDLLKDNIVQPRQCLGSTIRLQNCKTAKLLVPCPSSLLIRVHLQHTNFLI
jgi:hypothetical protein